MDHFEHFIIVKYGIVLMFEKTEHKQKEAKDGPSKNTNTIHELVFQQHFNQPNSN